VKRTSAAMLGLLAMSILPTSLSAKGDIVKITIKAPGRAAPIEITDSNIRAFHVWAGPGVRVNDFVQTEGFIIDWAQGSVPQPAVELPKYEVSFYSSGRVNGLVYVVSYVFDAQTSQGFVYLPGKDDERYSLNVATIYRHGLEGHWFRATSAWDNFVKPLIATVRAANQNR
jgi:hypothetical protein